MTSLADYFLFIGPELLQEFSVRVHYDPGGFQDQGRKRKAVEKSGFPLIRSFHCRSLTAPIFVEVQPGEPPVLLIAALRS